MATSNNMTYFLLYVALTLFSFAGLWRGWYLRKRLPKSARNVLLESIIFCGIFLLWSTVLTLLDLRSSDDPTVFVITVFTASIFLHMVPRVSIPLFAVNEAILLTGYLWMRNGVGLNSGIFINTMVMTILAATLSVMYYCNQSRDYAYVKTIAEKNAEIERMNQQLKILVQTDPLTGLLNRRFMDEILPGIWEQCQKVQKPLAFLMIDIDDFKHYNDQFGHQAGDQCIEKLAKVFQKYSDNANSFAFRYGGEEFAMVHLGLDKGASKELAETIRQEVESLFADQHITVSVGVYHGLPQSQDTADAFIHKADRALYRAKTNHKNQVVLDSIATSA
ncbi:GGDEF domain-containing protein [Gehongia tenuis]|uniref:GGDEF domain-containing protein n=1 Tax=Gehongia tenuis TaxID=2763655 RepID=A0A926D5T0_9FIRM|nr:GGDEF domain-containing protein [Gehongia tenuis]MBC8531898.1 GGDEF domain-containing protein [Gehongia tenuis]